MLDKELYNAVKELVDERYPSGWGGAAAVRVEDGTIYTSVAPEVINDATALCMETGAILEAHKFNKKITHSICLAREDEYSPLKVLRLVESVKNACFTGVLKCNARFQMILKLLFLKH